MNTRFANYFYEIGLDINTSLKDKIVQNEESKIVLSTSSSSLKSTKQTTEQVDNNSQDINPEYTEQIDSSRNLTQDNSNIIDTFRQLHPTSFKYKPDVLFRYPENDYNDGSKFPAYLSMV